MRAPRPALVAIVDDDQSVRESIRSLVKSFGFRTDLFESAEEFLSKGHFSDTACLILDIRMPGMSGLELQDRLAERELRIPIVFLTAHGENATRRRALEAGAVDFLPKPVREDALMSAVGKAVEKSEGTGRQP